MTEVRLEPRRWRAWPWLLALLVVAVLLWCGGELLTTDTASTAAVLRTAPRRSGHGAVIRPASPHRTTPTRDPRQEEALRIRSRMMA
jgi:hypothetical protein